MEDLNNLRKQFADSIGYKGDFDSKEFDIEFLSWLKIRLEILGDYEYLLEELDIDFMNDNTAEVDKSPFDSVVLPFNTKIITPYIDRFVNYHDSFNFDKRLIPGNIEVEYGVPYLRSLFDNNISNYISNLDVDNFMTQNPYDGFEKYKFHELHNTGIYGVVLGIYGNTYDKDYNSKLKSLYDVKSLFLDSDYVENYYVFGDKYFYVVASEFDKPNPIYVKSKKKA